MEKSQGVLHAFPYCCSTTPSSQPASAVVVKGTVASHLFPWRCCTRRCHDAEISQPQIETGAWPQPNMHGTPAQQVNPHLPARGRVLAEESAGVKGHDSLSSPGRCSSWGAAPTPHVLGRWHLRLTHGDDGAPWDRLCPDTARTRHSRRPCTPHRGLLPAVPASMLEYNFLVKCMCATTGGTRGPVPRLLVQLQ